MSTNWQVLIKDKELSDYQDTWQAMREYTDTRDENSPDQIWILEHPPVFTQGQNGKPEHVLNPGDIPVIQTDRGGQVTYHSPGQVIGYFMLDLKRRGLGIKKLVCQIEQMVIDLLAHYKIPATRLDGAPGVYVAGKKICSLGLRVRRNCTYHGLALNVDMDLEPFKRINPCGMQGIEVTQIRDFGATPPYSLVVRNLTAYMLDRFG